MAFRTNKMPVLQEKSASGAVATFNTALAMPLASCKISVTAWQEGSGDPAPDNVRNIVGYSALNITKTGKNTFKTDGLIYAEPSSTGWEPTNKRVFVPNSYCLGLGGNGYYSYNNQYFTSYTVSNNLIKFEKTLLPGYGVAVPVLDLKQGEKYTFSATCQNGNVSVLFYSEDGSYISRENSTTTYRTFTIPNNCKFTVFCFGVTAVNIEGTFTNIQLEVGSQATSYEPYVTPEVKTKQLGETVYGGSYNSVSGKLRVEYIKRIIDNDSTIYVSPSYIKSDACDAYLVAQDCVYNPSVALYNKVLGNNLKKVSVLTQIWRLEGYPNCFMINGQQIHMNISNDLLGITDYTQETTTTAKEKILTYLRDNPFEIVYPRATPIETDIGSMPISTNIGNNTIFADTGDIDLTYKDLDIAKRGNFREVFRLPS